MQQVPQPKPAANSEQTDMHTLILDRMNKYKTACSYCNSILGNRAQAVKMLESAERCKNVAAEYQATGVLKKENIAPALTP